jgi:two-component system NarL family sensor kinase
MSPEDQSNLMKVIEMIDQSCVQVRSISHNLVPASIVDFGLVATIEQYCSKIGRTNAIPIDFQYFGDPAVLTKEVETVIYRIIQELINNIIKHAKATPALVQMNFHENDLFITVEDNSVGFHTKKN